MKKLKFTNLKPVVVIIAFAFSLNSYASDFYWINGSGDWNDATHWSHTSGGASAMSVPSTSDKVIFDSNSFTGSHSQVTLTSNVEVSSLEMNSSNYFGIVGEGYNFKLKGNLTATGKFHMNFEKLILDANGPANLNTLNSDIFADIIFQSGTWDLHSTVQTARGYKIDFINGYLFANGHSIAADYIYANTNFYGLDLTNSHVVAFNSFNLSMSQNLGGAATFITLENETDPLLKGEFVGTSGSSFERNQTFDCLSGGMMVDVVTIDYAGGNNVTCDGVCDGEITLNAFGTAGGYSYAVDGSGFSSQTVYPSICQGNRLIQVRDTSQIIAPGPIYFTCTFSEFLASPPVLTVDLELAQPNDVSCFGICDGQAFTAGLGGTPPYTLTWATSLEVTPFPVALCAGQNDVQVVDANGCTVDTTMTIGGPPMITATLAITEPICNGDNNGEVLVTPAGGNGPAYTFSWNPIPTSGQGTNPGIGFSAGSITLTIFDGSGCPQDTTFDMTEPSPLTITANQLADATCFGVCNGQANSAPVGGAGGNIFEWFTCPKAGVTTGITDEDPTTLCAGDFYVIVTDLGGAGCTAESACITILEPTEIDATITITEPVCNGGNDGEVLVTPVGGNGPAYTFVWNPIPTSGQGSNPGIGFSAGPITLSIFDVLGCQRDTTFTMNEPPILSIAANTISDATCFSFCDGQANSTPVGGIGAHSIEWFTCPKAGVTTGITIEDPVTLCAGDYYAIVTDQGGTGCTAESACITILEPSQIDATLTITEPICNGDNNGEVLVVPVGGNGPAYTFIWNPIPTSGQGSNPGIGFSAGPITLSIFDVAGCQRDTTFNMTEPITLSISASTLTNATCFGVCDGQANSTPIGGAGGNVFEWFTCPKAGVTTGITIEDPTTLCAGDYYVIVSDQGGTGCTAESACISITEPTEIDAQAQAYQISCFGVCDGDVDVDATGGTPGYTYSWVTVPGGIGVGAADSLSGLCGGFYEIIVTDLNGCTSTPDTVEVIEPPQLTLGIVGTDPTCYDLCDGSAIATPGGGTPPYTYVWAPAPGLGQGTPTPSAMCVGLYTLDITDSETCTLQDQVTLTAPPLYDVTANQTNLLCAGDINGTIDVTVNSGGSGAGYTYLWAPLPGTGQGTPNVTGLSAGAWCVTITDGIGCDTTICYTITEPPVLTATASVISHVSCFGDCNGSAQVVIVGGTPIYSILWAPGGQTTSTASNLCAANYTVTVTDQNGCVAIDNVIINEPSQFTLTTAQTDNTCFGDCIGTATVTMTGGGTPAYTFLWDDAPIFQNTPTAINLCAGNYTVTVTDQNLCDTIIPFTIIEPPLIVIDTNVTNSACFASCSGAANITFVGGTGPFNFEWFDVLTGLPLGVNNVAITGLCPGQYYAQITDAALCVMNSDTITITELPEILTSVISTTDNTCGLCDGTAEVLATGGTGTFTYTWAPAPGAGQGTPIATGLCGGAYSVTATDQAGCTANIAVNINSVATEVLTMDSTNITCFGLCDGTATVTYTSIDPPYTVAWFDNISGLPVGVVDGPPASNPSSTTGLCAGEYLVVLTNASGCVTSDTVSVIEPPEISGLITPTDVTCSGACDGTAVIAAAGGTGLLTFLWNPLPGSGQGTPSAGGLCAGNWDVTVTDSQGCNVNFPTIIAEPTLLVIDAESATDVSCFGANDGTATVLHSGGTGPYSYQWIDCNTGLPIGQTNQVALNLGPGDYQVIITDIIGCSVTGACQNVAEPTPITSTINVSGVNCYGLCDGLLDAIPGGGTAPYFFQWQDEFLVDLPGQTNDTMNNVCQGLFNLVITDFNGCTQSFGPIDMTTPLNPWDITESQTNVTCSGTCDGTATVTVNAGNTAPYTFQWDDVPLLQVTPTAINLCAGVYNVTISDAGSCDTTIQFTIIDANPIIANANITNVLCFGACTGQVDVSPTGGVPPYAVTWSDLQVGDTAFALCSGMITATIIDAIGCQKDTIIDITEPTEITATSSFANNSACGACNGSATVNVAGGVPAYSYLWTPAPGVGQGTNNATAMCPGIYSLDVTDQNGCVYNEIFAIADIPSEVLTMDSTDVSCFGLCDGGVEVIYICGDPACTNQWYDGLTGLQLVGQTGTTMSNLCAGDYYVEVTNASGCIAIGQIEVAAPTQIIANEVVSQITCNGVTDGSIVLAASGGSGAGYTYTWTPVPPNGQGTNQALNLSAGNWCVDIQDGSGCIESYCYLITEPTPIILDPTVTNPLCNGDCNGFITIIASGGYGVYTYQWLDGGGAPIPGETNTLISNLCAGNYTIEVTDSGGCVQSQLITLSEPGAITSPISGTDVLCFGDCSGTATVVPAGGFPPYVINWYNTTTGLLIGQTGLTATGLCPDDYHAVISDANGCSFTTPSVTLIEPPLLTWTINTNDASCFGVCDGDADIVPAGGTPAYTYEWLDISGTPVVGGLNAAVINLCAGNYTIELTDANGCTSGQEPVVINEFPQITANVFSNDATCGLNDGNASVFPLGGNPPYSYQWMDNLLNPIVGETNNTLLNVGAGTYFVEVTDANGCTEIFQANVSNLSTTTFAWDTVNDPSCFGGNDGSIAITANTTDPPLSYTWNPGGLVDEDPTGLTAGTWTVQITDGLGCINFYDTTLIDPAQIQVTATSTPSDCGQCNGSIDLVIIGGTGAINILWNNGMSGTPITGLCPSLYEAQITDQNGCLVIEQVDVPNNSGFTVSQTITAITCAGACDGQVVVGGIGGTPPYSYLWLHNGSTSDTQAGLCAGSYFVSVTDAAGCNYSIEVVMTDPNAIQAVETIFNPACGANDGSITVVTSGGVLPHTYLWNTADVTPAITNLAAGIYTLTVTDLTGCTEVFVYGLTNSDAPVAMLTITDMNCASVCDGQIDTSSVIGGTPAFTYQWLDAAGLPIAGETNPLISALCSGDYFLEITDGAGCISFEAATIAEPDTILLNPLFMSDPSCFGICDGQLIANPIGGTLPFIFLWDDPNASTTVNADSLCDGAYNLLITDANGCVANQTGTLTEPTAITVVTDSINDAYCWNSSDGEIFVTVTGGTAGYTIEWISEDLVDTLSVEDPTNLGPQDYYLTILDANGCIYTDTLNVDTIVSVLAVAGADMILCLGEIDSVYGYSNVDPLANLTWWDTTLANGFGTSNYMIPPSNTAGSFTYIFVASYLGCSHADTIVVTVVDSITVDAGLDIEMFSNQTEPIGGSPTASDLTHTLIWSPPTFLSDTTVANPDVIQPTAGGWYYVTASDTNGCTAIDSMFVTLRPDIIIPNGISPDDNGLNDVWILDFIDLYPNVSIKIGVYNRWGEPIFAADEHYKDDWGGTTSKGKRLPAGTYYYTIDIDHEDFPEPFTGPITIMW